MSSKELDMCKKYIKDYLSKGFITASTALYALLVLFVYKLGGRLRFYIDY